MTIDPQATENSPQYDAVLDSDERVDAPTNVSTAQDADVVHITGNAGDVHARIVTVENGGVARATSEALTLNVRNGGVGAAAANTFDALLENSGVGAVAARSVTIKGGRVAMMAAGSVTLSEGARVLFDMRAGVLAGLVAGLVLGATYVAARLLGGAPPKPRSKSRGS
jgi:hypothetical protein